MDSKLQDRASPPDANTLAGGAASATETSPLAPPNDQRSWGDKYKRGTLHVIRNILVNYVVNFGISAAGTYAVLNSPLNRHFDSFISKAVEVGNKANVPEGLSRGVANFFSKTQLLLCGGHILLPFMKYTHDNRSKLEFGIGEKLDKLQETLGRGNEASKRNLAEYRYINDLMKAKTPTDQLSDADKALLAKHNIGDNLQFSEHKETWGHVLKARATGVSVTTTMGILFGLTAKLPEKAQMDTITKKAGGFLSEHAGLNKIPKQIISKPAELGEYAFLELLYTAGSKLGFDQAEKRQLKKREMDEEAAAKAKLTQDRSALASQEIQPAEAPARTFASRVPAADARKTLVSGGEKDFRTREVARPEQTSLAMS